MKRILNILLVFFVTFSLCSCTITDSVKPYEGDLCRLQIFLKFPKGYEKMEKDSVKLVIEEENYSYKYIVYTDTAGVSVTTLPKGLYRVSTSEYLLNGTRNNYRLLQDDTLNLNLLKPLMADLVVKEIYCGGCKKWPEEGNYQSDKYVIIHNNSAVDVYLDSLCFGTLCPYNSNSNNPWGSIQDFAPVIQALWMFDGDGKTHVLAPGADAVICLNGAIDHTAQYPLSVNLNNSAYFVAYDNKLFPNVIYHPAPGDQIQQDHILKCVVKLGKANAYTFSITSPTFIMFRSIGMSIEKYINIPGNIIDVPGSPNDKVVKVPWVWIYDGVEVFRPGDTNKKRLRGDVDAGYVTLTESYQGRSLMRKVDEEASAVAGYEVLKDSNNSSNDMYESEHASLYKEKE